MSDMASRPMQLSHSFTPFFGDPREGSPNGDRRADDHMAPLMQKLVFP